MSLPRLTATATYGGIGLTLLLLLAHGGPWLLLPLVLLAALGGLDLYLWMAAHVQRQHVRQGLPPVMRPPGH